MWSTVEDVSSWVVVAQEEAGDDAKLWLAPPGEAVQEDKSDWWVYKPVKRASYRRYDVVSEFICSGLASLIELPAAEIRLVRRRVGPSDSEGVISRNVAAGWNIEAGDVLLSALPGYVSCRSRPTDRVGHSLPNIRRVLERYQGPPGSVESWSAFDVFVGYLAFDAWVANTDRHAENWAVMDRPGQLALAPSFDHGNALGSGMREEDLPASSRKFCARGMAQRFEAGRKVDLVTHALSARDLGSPRSDAWFNRISQCPGGDVAKLLDNTPRLSVARRTFIEEVLAINGRRLAP